VIVWGRWHTHAGVAHKVRVLGGEGNVLGSHSLVVRAQGGEGDRIKLSLINGELVKCSELSWRWWCIRARSLRKKLDCYRLGPHQGAPSWHGDLGSALGSGPCRLHARSPRWLTSRRSAASARGRPKADRRCSSAATP